MRSLFRGYLRPNDEELSKLWKSAVFAIDANVLLNLYRYSNETRRELEASLESIGDRLFLPHQAAKEFLKNRLVVTADQANEYTKAVSMIEDLSKVLSHKKRHPFISPELLPDFREWTTTLVEDLNDQQGRLLERLNKDEILTFIEGLFDNKTGQVLSQEIMSGLIDEGEARYQKRIPPGYKDSKKDDQSDPFRPYGDLILWKQLVAKARQEKKPVILISDDKKEDWWLEQSGRTIMPRPELREEFISEAGLDFWMYSVDKFLTESALDRKQQVSEAAIKEVIQIRDENTKRRSERPPGYPYQLISKEELFERLKLSEKWAASREGFLGLHQYVQGYLGNAGFDYSASYDAIDDLARAGLVEIYDHQGEGHDRPLKCIRVIDNSPSETSPFRDLKQMMKKHEEN